MKSTTKKAVKACQPTPQIILDAYNSNKDSEIYCSENQKSLIFSYLFLGNKITALEALKLFNCFSLAQRIKNLRDEGCEIETEMIRTDSKKTIARYSLKSKSA